MSAGSIPMLAKQIPKKTHSFLNYMKFKAHKIEQMGEEELPSSVSSSPKWL